MPKKLRPFGEHRHMAYYHTVSLDDSIGYLENLLDEECGNYDCTKDAKRSPRSKRVELVETALNALREASEI